MSTQRKTIKTVTIRAMDLQPDDVVQVRPAEKPNKAARWEVVQEVRVINKGRTVAVRWAPGDHNAGGETYPPYELVTIQQEVGPDA